MFVVYVGVNIPTNKPYFDPEINKNMRQSVGLPTTQCLLLTNYIPPCIVNLSFTLRFVMS